MAWAKDFLQNIENLKKFDEFKNIGNEENADAYKVNAETCWSNMIKYRKASICFTCSARSEVFFKNSKGLVDEQY